MNKFGLHPESASTFATEWDALYLYLWGVTAFFTVLIFVLVAYFAIRYRRKEGDTSIPRPILGSMGLEILWTVIPLFFVMTFFFWGAHLFFRQYRTPENTLDIHVVGKQWMWKIQHPNGTREINELHVPTGRPVKLVLGSQDVIHSFYIPAFRIKMDAVPGRYTTTWFEATKPGEYHLFCTEYCGLDHSRMIGKVVVMEPEAYQAWLAGTVVDEAPAQSGQKLFVSLGCQSCHAAQAPTMAGLFGSRQRMVDGSEVVANEDYLRRSILNSTDEVVEGFQPIMPSYRGVISEDQLGHLLAYIKSLKDSRQDEIAPPRAAPEGQTP